VGDCPREDVDSWSWHGGQRVRAGGASTTTIEGKNDMRAAAATVTVLACLGLAALELPDSRADDLDPMDQFGTTASNVFFYYDDLESATAFYREVLGLRVAADYGQARIMQVAPASFITLVDASIEMHTADEPKTVAIALVTDQLEEWWEYIGTQEVAMRSTAFQLQEGKPHDGFVAIDPEGYLLEFERFNPHEENVRFLPLLDAGDTYFPPPGSSRVPAGLGFKATIVWFYYKDMERMQRFYEDVMGFDLIVDQGWAKIYPIGPGGYFGLVDEQRGMHRFTEQKGVTLSLITSNLDGWYGYLEDHDEVVMRSKEISETDRYRAFVAYDPEGYYLEWDVFSDVPDNEVLLGIIDRE
jgi:catechol 2,3-dioxygenase-like lactoylglutathione lyase family enzyme